MKQKILLITTFLIITTVTAFLCVFPPNTRADSNDQPLQLKISGTVTNSSSFTLADLQAMPQATIEAAIYCVDFPGKIVEQGRWEGVTLWDLLSQVGVLPSAVKVAFFAGDYSTDLTLQTAQNSDVIVAYAKDGAPLAGLRLVVPGHWGYKWISNLDRIELVDYDFKGKWESQGYSDDATITQRNLYPTRSPGVPTPTPTALPTNAPTSTTSPAATSTSTPTALPTTPTPSTVSVQPQENTLTLVQTMVIGGVIVVAIIALGAVIVKGRKTFTALQR